MPSDNLSSNRSPITTPTSPLSRVTSTQSTTNANKGVKPDNATDPDFVLNEKADMAPNQPTSSESSTFFRRFTTKFRLSAPRTVQHPAVVSHGVALPNSLVARGNREAALRERGLLPNKDLSEQERDLDRKSSLETTSSEDSGAETAATRIKAEWEANNREGAHTNNADQLNTFKSSESKSAADTSFEAEVVLALALESISEEPASNCSLSTAAPSAAEELDLPQIPSQDVTCIAPLPSPSTPRHTRTPPPILLCIPSPVRSFPPTTVEPWSIALPPSPVLSTTDLSSPPCSPTISHMDTPSSSQLSLSATPLLQTHLETPSSPGRIRTKSAPTLPSLSESESLAPSSIATPSSPVGSPCSPEITSAPEQERDSARQALGIKTQPPQDHDGNNIPIIAESPLDEEMVIPHPANDAPNDTTAPSESGPRPGQNERRKSFLGFMKDRPPRSAPSKRSSSMANLRSVMGSLRSRPSKAKAAARTLPPSFDASHLPPSPTLPASFASRPSLRVTVSGPDQDAGAPADARQALSPTIHSLGSILVSTRGIEDEESRRLSEMAFLN